MAITNSRRWSTINSKQIEHDCTRSALGFYKAKHIISSAQVCLCSLYYYNETLLDMSFFIAFKQLLSLSSTSNECLYYKLYSFIDIKTVNIYIEKCNNYWRNKDDIVATIFIQGDW